MFKSKKKISKLIVPVAALVAIVAQNYGFELVTAEKLEAFFNAALALAVAFGIVANNDKE